MGFVSKSMHFHFQMFSVTKMQIQNRGTYAIVASAKNACARKAICQVQKLSKASFCKTFSLYSEFRKVTYKICSWCLINLFQSWRYLCLIWTSFRWRQIFSLNPRSLQQFALGAHICIYSLAAEYPISKVEEIYIWSELHPVKCFPWIQGCYSNMLLADLIIPV